MDEENKIDFFGPDVIFAFVAAFIGDITFFFIITHYLCGAFVLGFLWHKTKGVPAKAILISIFLVPFPFLTIGAFLALIISKSKLVEVVLEQVAIQGVALVTGGAGEALEGAALAGEGAEVAATAAEAAEGAGAAAEAGEAATSAAEGAETEAEAGERSVGEKIGEKAEEKGEEKTKEKLSGDENARPSEKSTEHGSGDNTEGNRPQESEEDRRKREKDKDYEEMMETEAETPPIEQAEKELFSERGPQSAQGIETPKEQPQKPGSQENESTRRLRERFEKAQKVREQLDKLKQPQGAQEEEDEDEDEDGKVLGKAA